VERWDRNTIFLSNLELGSLNSFCLFLFEQIQLLFFIVILNQKAFTELLNLTIMSVYGFPVIEKHFKADLAFVLERLNYLHDTLGINLFWSILVILSVD
jgi:hypothetical protein